MINYKVVIYILSTLLIGEAIFMLLCAPISVLYGDPDAPAFILSAGVTFFIGGLAYLLTRETNRNMGKREGYIITSVAWVVFSLFGSLPFFVSRAIPSYTDAFFETMSGFTTTGASILNNIEALSHGLLFWRSLTQWLGGMGIIVMSLAILPILGIGGMQLFVAEVPGPMPDKLHPRIKETAKRLWGIYIIFTIAEVLLLVLGKMPLFDAICHSFATMATGGYSTKQASVAFYASPYLQYVITLFMFVAGINFTLSYFALHRKFGAVFRNEEFKWYTGITLGFTLVIFVGLLLTESIGVEKAFRDAIFQVVSITTTTGFATVDYLNWFPLLGVLIFLLMFCWGFGRFYRWRVKVVRIMVMIKNSWLELKRIIHPNAIIPLRLNSIAVSPQIISNVMAFISVYFLVVFISVVIVSAMGYDLETSFGAVAATLGNIGPGIGQVGPAHNFAHFPAFGKWFLSFLMLIGRLELFTVLVITDSCLLEKIVLAWAIGQATGQITVSFSGSIIKREAVLADQITLGFMDFNCLCLLPARSLSHQHLPRFCATFHGKC
ncbi:MAG: TrkH family potassium uptake protein [Bacteroidales bacterium]|nr:TrkH family potassium uptake protein [Bacteroidales bacterium]